MAGLLDTNPTALDPNVGQTIQGLLSQFQPSQADQANARNQAQLQFFLGLMGARKGSEYGAIGQSGIAALQGYQNYIKEQQALRSQNMQATMPLLGLMQRMQIAKSFAGDGPAPAPVTNGVQPQAGVAPSTAAQFGPDQFPQSSPTNAIMPAPQGIAGPMTGFANLPPAPMQVPPGTNPTQVNGFQPPDWRTEMPPSVRAIVAQTFDPATMAKAAEDYSSGVPGRNGMMFSKSGRPLYQVTNAGIQYFNPDGTPGSFVGNGPGNTTANATRAATIAGATTGAEKTAELPLSFQTIPNGMGGKITLPGDLAMQVLRGQSALPSNPAPSVPGASQSQPDAPSLSDAAVAAANAPQPKSVAAGQTLSPDMLKYRETRASELAQNMTQFTTEARAATEQNATLADIQKQVQSFTPGALTNAGAQVAQFLTGAGVDQSNPIVQWLAHGAIGAVQASNKDTLLLQTAMTKSLGSREAAQIFMKLLEANPSSGMTPDGMAKVVDYLQGVNNWKIQRASDALDWTNSPKNPSGTLEGFEPWYNTTKPPQQFIGHLVANTVTPADAAAQARGYGISLNKGVASAPNVTANGINSQPSVPQLTPSAQGNKTASALINRVLQSGDPAKIEELRGLGWLQ